VLCDQCYKDAKAYIADINRLLSDKIALDSGIIRDKERNERWCAEHDRRRKKARR
jgi:hypothetical protein